MPNWASGLCSRSGDLPHPPAACRGRPPTINSHICPQYIYSDYLYESLRCLSQRKRRSKRAKRCFASDGATCPAIRREHWRPFPTNLSRPPSAHFCVGRPLPLPPDVLPRPRERSNCGNSDPTPQFAGDPPICPIFVLHLGIPLLVSFRPSPSRSTWIRSLVHPLARFSTARHSHRASPRAIGRCEPQVSNSFSSQKGFHLSVSPRNRHPLLENDGNFACYPSGRSAIDRPSRSVHPPSLTSQSGSSSVHLIPCRIPRWAQPFHVACLCRPLIGRRQSGVPRFRHLLLRGKSPSSSLTSSLITPRCRQRPLPSISHSPQVSRSDWPMPIVPATTPRPLPPRPESSSFVRFVPYGVPHWQGNFLVDSLLHSGGITLLSADATLGHVPVPGTPNPLLSPFGPPLLAFLCGK